METSQHLSLQLTPDDIIKLRTTDSGQTHEIALDRDEFEQLFHHLIRLRAKLDLRDARGVIDERQRHGRA